MPFGGGCGPGTNANYKYQLCKIYCVIYLEIFSILQSKQCLRRLNLTFQASHTFLLLPVGKSRDYAFATSRPTTSFNSARSELSAVYTNVSDTLQRSQSAATNCQQKALLSSSLLQLQEICLGVYSHESTVCMRQVRAYVCYRRDVWNIMHHTCILQHSVSAAGLVFYITV